MKRTITTLALAASMMLLAIPAALAKGGPPLEEGTTCQQGADNDFVGAWDEWDKDAVIGMLLSIRPETDPFPNATARATAIMNFNDHNSDGLLCVQVHNLPNDASGTDTWWSLQDNHYDPPQSNA